MRQLAALLAWPPCSCWSDAFHFLPPAPLPCSFTTYVMLQAFLAKPLSLLRLWGLLFYWLRTRQAPPTGMPLLLACPWVPEHAHTLPNRAQCSSRPARRLAATERAKARLWRDQTVSYGGLIPGELPAAGSADCASSAAACSRLSTLPCLLPPLFQTTPSRCCWASSSASSVSLPGREGVQQAPVEHRNPRSCWARLAATQQMPAGMLSLVATCLPALPCRPHHRSFLPGLLCDRL